MYAPAPSAEELKLIGITAEDVADNSEVEVWPENWKPFQVFAAMTTQWRTGANGPTGLDYKVLTDVEERLGIKKKHKQYTFVAIREMEREALAQMSHKS